MVPVSAPIALPHRSSCTLMPLGLPVANDEGLAGLEVRDHVDLLDAVGRDVLGADDDVALAARERGDDRVEDGVLDLRRQAEALRDLRADVDVRAGRVPRRIEELLGRIRDVGADHQLAAEDQLTGRDGDGRRGRGRRLGLGSVDAGAAGEGLGAVDAAAAGDGEAAGATVGEGVALPEHAPTKTAIAPASANAREREIAMSSSSWCGDPPPDPPSTCSGPVRRCPGASLVMHGGVCNPDRPAAGSECGPWFALRDRRASRQPGMPTPAISLGR